jgi:hypothetical protein
MSDLRERLRICSLAQLSLLEITCISSLIREPTEPATKRLSRRTFFLSSLALRADSAGSLCLADRRYDGPQPVCLTTSPPRRRARLAALLANLTRAARCHGAHVVIRRRHVGIRRRECLRLGRRPRRPPHRLRLLRLPRLLLARATAHRRQRRRHHAAHGLHQPSVQPRLAARLRGRASGAALLRLPDVPSTRHLVQPSGRLRVPAAVQLRTGK